MNGEQKRPDNKLYCFGVRVMAVSKRGPAVYGALLAMFHGKNMPISSLQEGRKLSR